MLVATVIVEKFGLHSRGYSRGGYLDYIHTCMHTYIHTYVHTYTYIRFIWLSWRSLTFLRQSAFPAPTRLSCANSTFWTSLTFLRQLAFLNESDFPVSLWIFHHSLTLVPPVMARCAASLLSHHTFVVVLTGWGSGLKGILSCFKCVSVVVYRFQLSRGTQPTETGLLAAWRCCTRGIILVLLIY